MRRRPLHPSHLLAGLAVAGLVLVGASPAGATGNGNGNGNDNDVADKVEEPAQSNGKASDHDGDADSDSSTSYTEDNDTNDGGTKNNVADDGDNRHPSGKDRSVENGKSGNQGKAESDPDDDGRGPDRSNGGPDKPNGSGGVDEADQDGNNGCGNDDDFEDDNEGWCGRKPKESQPAPEPEAKPEAKPCPDGSMSRPCSEKAKSKPKAETKSKPKAETKSKAKPAPKPCPDGSMTRPCTKSDTKTVNGTADITVDAECRQVTVTSSKDISNVVISFVDGTSTKFEGLRGGSWTRRFTQNVASATAKSATSVVTGMANGCADTGTVLDQAATMFGGAMGVDCSHDGDELADDADTPFLCTALGSDDLGARGDAAANDEGAVRSASAEQGRGANAEVPASTVSARSGGSAILAGLPVLGDVLAGELPMTGGNILTLVALAGAALTIGMLFVRASRRKAGVAS